MKNSIDWNFFKFPDLTILPFHILSIIYGTLLGDSTAKKRSNKTRFLFNQSHHHKDYLLSLHKIFAEAGLTNPIIPEVKERLNSKPLKDGSFRQAIAFNTFSYSSFNFIYDEWYPEGKKVVPQSISKYLDERALAHWLMDDGSKQEYGFTLCCESFSKVDIEFLRSILKSNFNIETILRNHKKEMNIFKDDILIETKPATYRIYIPSESIKILKPIVKPFIVPSMLYKIQ